MVIMHISRDIIKQLYMAMKLIINPLDETWGRAPERDRCYHSAYAANALEDITNKHISTNNNEYKYHTNASPVEWGSVLMSLPFLMEVDKLQKGPTG